MVRKIGVKEQAVALTMSMTSKHNVRCNHMSAFSYPDITGRARSTAPKGFGSFQDLTSEPPDFFTMAKGKPVGPVCCMDSEGVLSPSAKHGCASTARVSKEIPGADECSASHTQPPFLRISPSPLPLR